VCVVFRIQLGSLFGKGEFELSFHDGVEYIVHVLELNCHYIVIISSNHIHMLPRYTP
jgi:hypothetical protein